MRGEKIVSKAKTMKEAKEEVLRFTVNDRGWKGASVIVEIKDGKDNWYGSMHSLKVREELYKGCIHDLYLCVGHFSSKATAYKMVDDLTSGKLSLEKAMEKSVKSFERWVAKVIANLPHGAASGQIGRNQLIYFGASKGLIARLDQVNKKYEAHIEKEVKKYETQRVS